MPSDWLWPDVKAAIEKRGTNLAGISRRAGYHRSAAQQVRYRSWPEMQAVIAAAINVTPQTIWPSRYYVAGNPLHPNTSTARRARNVQKSKAA